MTRCLALLALLVAALLAVPLVASAQVQAGARFVLTDYEADESGVTLHFVSPNPGPGQATDYYVRVLDNEIAGQATAESLSAFILTKLQKKIRAAGYSTKVDPLLGREYVP